MVAIKKLYYSTDELISRFKPSLSNYFDIFINDSFSDGKTTIDNSEINFLAYEAVLPGTSYETTQVFGDRQGLTETFANKRVYPPVDISFYIDYDYKVLRYFESWMKNISPNIGASYQSYQKFQYPENNGKVGYKKEIIISKFERNFREPSQRLVQGGVYEMPENWCTYTLRNAYPTNLISVPVSYEGSNILKTTVTFNYDVYSFALGNPYTNSAGSDITSGTSTSGTTGSGSGNSTTGTGTATVGLAGEGNVGGIESLSSQINELREMRLRSQNRIREQGGVPVTPELQGPPSPTY